MNYKNARDLSWKILLEENVCALPVDIKRICRNRGIQLFTYRQGQHFIESAGLKEHTSDNDAFSICNVIFYDDKTSEARQRFSIAHELGHILLHLPPPNEGCTVSFENAEREANVFASRLLAPLCVIQFLNLNSAEEIADVCNVSYSAAQLRFSRLCEIRHRNSERRHSGTCGTFLLSRLERQVLENFKEYIEKNKRGD